MCVPALTESEIPAFLYCGYTPQYYPAPLNSLCDWPNQKNRRAAATQRDRTSLIAEGLEVLKTVFRESINETRTAKTHVLPLSGGFDSRAILGGLLENMNSSRIQTVTFGVPGAWDFEIGQQVARSAGVRCELIDLSSTVWKWDTLDLIKTAKRTECPLWVFDVYVNHHLPNHFDADCVFWSGFMGDPLAGSHLLGEDSITWEQAMTRFVVRNRFSKSIDLTPPDFKPENCLPQSPLLDYAILCYDEQLDFGIRQQCYVKPLVLPRDYNYCTPFLHQEWVNFILSVPHQYREGQYLYKEILKTAYPTLFSLPVKNNKGLPLTAPKWRRKARVADLYSRLFARRIFPNLCYFVHPGLNYIDFDRGLCKRNDLKEVVYENIQDLKKRGIVDWIDIDSIWSRHQQQKAKHADALTLLASLEINLKAEEATRT